MSPTIRQKVAPAQHDSGVALTGKTSTSADAATLLFSTQGGFGGNSLWSGVGLLLLLHGAFFVVAFALGAVPTRSGYFFKPGAVGVLPLLLLLTYCSYAVCIKGLWAFKNRGKWAVLLVSAPWVALAVVRGGDNGYWIGIGILGLVAAPRVLGRNRAGQDAELEASESVGGGSVKQPEATYSTSGGLRVVFAFLGAIMAGCLSFCGYLIGGELRVRWDADFILPAALLMVFGFKMYQVLRNLWQQVRQEPKLACMFDHFVLLALMPPGRKGLAWATLFGRYQYAKLPYAQIEQVYKKRSGPVLVRARGTGGAELPTLLHMVGPEGLANIQRHFNSKGVTVSGLSGGRE